MMVRLLFQLGFSSYVTVELMIAEYGINELLAQSKKLY